MDENKEVNSTDPKREKVRVIPLSAIDDAPDHPFGVRDDEEMAELVESISDQKTDIVRVKNTIERGQQITANDLEIVRVGSYNLPDGIIKDGKSVVGKYATATLFAGDYLFSEKITGESNSAADILAALDGKKVAISVSIGSYADGLSGKLENGDIISIIIYNKEEYRSYIPAELRYVRVITTTTESGVDQDENIDDGKAITVTLLVTPEQAELLSQYESVTSMHFVLVYRGDILPAKQHNEPSGNNGNGRKPH